MRYCLLMIVLCWIMPSALAEEWKLDPERAVLLWEDEAHEPANTHDVREASDAHPVDGTILEVGTEQIRIAQGSVGVWTVTRESVGADAPAWSRTLSVPAVPLASRGRPAQRITIARRGLEGREADVIVMLGSGALIAALDARTGLVRWEVPYVWELQRYMAPPPMGTIGFRRVRRKGARARLLNDANLAFGPIAVPAKDGAYRVFAGVTVSRRHETGTALPESRVYEIDSGGNTMASVQMPVPLVDDGAIAVVEGLVVHMVDGVVARIEPSFQEVAGWRGWESTRRFARIAWLVSPPRRGAGGSETGAASGGPPPWLTVPAGLEALALQGTRLVAGEPQARLDRSTNGMWTFPLRLLDTNTGMPGRATLRIPVVGTVPAPSTNYAATHEDGGLTRYRSRVSYAARVSKLTSDGDRLAIELETTPGQRVVCVFVLPGARSASRAEGPLPASAQVKSIDRVRDRPAESLTGFLTDGWPWRRPHAPAAMFEADLPGTGTRMERLAALVATLPASLHEPAINALTLEGEWAEVQTALSLERRAALVREMVASDGWDWLALLGPIIEEAPELAFPILSDIAAYPSGQIDRNGALVALWQLGESGQARVWRAWREHARDRAGEVRDLGTFGDDHESRISAQPAWHARLRGALDDADPYIRGTAAMELANLEDARARRGLADQVAVSLRSGFLFARRAAAQLAWQLTRDDPAAAAKLAPILVEAIEVSDAVTLDWCCGGLEKLGGRARGQLGALMARVAHAAGDRRVRLLPVLVEICAPEDADVAALLARDVEHSDASVAKTAAWCLKRLERRREWERK